MSIFCVNKMLGKASSDLLSLLLADLCVSLDALCCPPGQELAFLFEELAVSRKQGRAFLNEFSFGQLADRLMFFLHTLVGASDHVG